MEGEMGRIEETVLTLTTNGDLDSQNLRMLIRIEFTYVKEGGTK
jgi:hypothetical protein